MKRGARFPESWLKAREAAGKPENTQGGYRAVGGERETELRERTAKTCRKQKNKLCLMLIRWVNLE